jgi:hypothetical protein
MKKLILMVVILVILAGCSTKEYECRGKGTVWGTKISNMFYAKIEMKYFTGAASYLKKKTVKEICDIIIQRIQERMD